MPEVANSTTLRRSCTSCALLRKRCSGTQPCESCARAERNCVYEINKRKLRGEERREARSKSKNVPTESAPIESDSSTPTEITLSKEDVKVLLHHMQPSAFADELSFAQIHTAESEQMLTQRDSFVHNWVPPSFFTPSSPSNPSVTEALVKSASDSLLQQLKSLVTIDNGIINSFNLEIRPYQPPELSLILFGGTNPQGPFSLFNKPNGENYLQKAVHGDLPRQKWLSFLQSIRSHLNQRLVMFESFFASLAVMGSKSDAKVPLELIRPTLILIALTQTCMQLCPESLQTQEMFPNIVQLSSMLGFPDLQPSNDKILFADWTNDDMVVARNTSGSMVVTAMHVAILSHKRPIWPVPRKMLIGDLLAQPAMDHKHEVISVERMTPTALTKNVFGSFQGKDFKSFLQMWFVYGQIIDFKLAMEHESFEQQVSLEHKVSNEKIADIFRLQLHDLFGSFTDSIQSVLSLTEDVIGKNKSQGIQILQSSPVDRARLVVPDMALLLIWHNAFCFLEYRTKLVDRDAEIPTGRTYSKFNNIFDVAAEPFTVDPDSYIYHHQGMLGVFKLAWLLMWDPKGPSTAPLRYLLSREYWRFCLFHAGCTASNILLYLLKPLEGHAFVDYVTEQVEMDGNFAKSSGRCPIIRIQAATPPESASNDALLGIQGAKDNLETVLKVMELATAWGLPRMRSARDNIETMFRSGRFRPSAELGPSWSSLGVK